MAPIGWPPGHATRPAAGTRPAPTKTLRMAISGVWTAEKYAQVYQLFQSHWGKPPSSLPLTIINRPCGGGKQQLDKEWPSLDPPILPAGVVTRLGYYIIHGSNRKSHHKQVAVCITKIQGSTSALRKRPNISLGFVYERLWWFSH